MCINKLADIRRMFLGCSLGLKYNQNGYRQKVVKDNFPFGRVDELCKLVDEGRPD